VGKPNNRLAMPNLRYFGTALAIGVSKKEMMMTIHGVFHTILNLFPEAKKWTVEVNIAIFAGQRGEKDDPNNR